MDFSNPWAIVSGLFISLIGTALFIHGKKQADFRTLVAGVALCALPCVVGSLLVEWLACGGCLAGLWAWIRYGG